ncbi:MAG: peptidoglycan-binding domain-containing protein [Bacteroidales bacterium]|jgi:hypothetical protein
METNKRKKLILIGLGTAAAGVATFFGWNYVKKFFKPKNEIPDFNNNEKDILPSSNSIISPKKNIVIPSNKNSRNDDFPLKKGSKGAKVKTLQEYLISKYGKTILPKYGADGDFGDETVSALKKSGIPEVIDESTYNVLVSGNAIEPKTLAQTLYNAAVSKNINLVLQSLKSMKTTKDYSAVSETFKEYRFGMVRKTLVNGMLDSFTSESDKQKIRLEFSRMGLKYDGSKWSLSGIPGRTLITICPARIWKSAKESMKVSENTVLGIELGQKGEYSAFENNGQSFIVKSNSVNYL